MGEKNNYVVEIRNYICTCKEDKGFYSEVSCAYSNICMLRQQLQSGLSNANHRIISVEKELSDHWLQPLTQHCHVYQ